MGVAKVMPLALKTLLLIVPVNVNVLPPLITMFAPMFNVAPKVSGTPILNVQKSSIKVPVYAPPVKCARVLPENKSVPVVVVNVPLLFTFVTLIVFDPVALALVTVPAAAFASVPAPCNLPVFKLIVPELVNVTVLAIDNAEVLAMLIVPLFVKSVLTEAL